MISASSSPDHDEPEVEAGDTQVALAAARVVFATSHRSATSPRRAGQVIVDAAGRMCRRSTEPKADPTSSIS